MISEAEYLVEIFPKLNQLQIYWRSVVQNVECSISNAKFHCTYEETETGEEKEILFEISNFFPSVMSESHLQNTFATNTQRNTFTILALTTSVRFSEAKITIPGNEVSQSIVAPLLDDYTAQKLSVRDIHTLFCKHCSSCLISTDFTRILSLPSPYWLEFADLWICTCTHGTPDHDHSHQHGSSKDRFKQFPLSEIQAKEKICFIGNNFVMLHKNDMNSNSFSIRKDENGNSIVKLPTIESANYNVAFSIECTQCNKPLGYLEPQTEGIFPPKISKLISKRIGE